MRLRDYGIGREQIRQGGGRGSGNDHVDELYGATEFYIHQPAEKQVNGFDGLKAFVEANECELVPTLDAPVELQDGFINLRITHRRAGAVPPAVIKRAHSWAHQRNLLHSFFKPLYR